MFARLLLLFVTVPLIELFILLDLSSVIGIQETILLIIVTGVLGAYLAKQEGIKAFTQVQLKLNAGEMPGHELLDGLLILVAGAVLLTPGILTDMFGLLLLLGPAREKIKKILIARFSKGSTFQQINIDRDL